ncbi:MAG TPA: LeuA family protein [Thermoflexales bacterium]|nr:LeuA family protein [Thermoflexales bacterium]HQW35598.1 LeuA family protein [Thermoflexales bacterium]HQZ22195.1 LeuA family protein [Thermoflexales bacterium]HQZ98616.1 LeuA family protein [Thermoflexales bacterium]
MAFSFRDYIPRKLEIVDVTLREGQQSSLLHDHYKYFFTTQDKIEIARALILYGVKFLELFAPSVSSKEAEDFAAIRQARDELIVQKGYTFLLAHVRCHPADVEAAIKAGADGLNMYIGTSDVSVSHKHGMGIDEITKLARELLEDVRKNHPNIILRFSGEDAFRTSELNLFRVYDEVAPLVDRFGTPDTVGVATPASVRERVQRLRERYPNVALEGHFHDDRSFAIINAMEAVRSGMQYINTTLLGIGERSGITSMTGLIFNLFVDKNYDYLDNYHLRGSYPINVMMADKLRKLVPSKEPVSLTNRTHAAGVHTKAVLNNASTYEAHALDQFGVTESEVLLGPLSGWNVMHYFLHEICGFEIDEPTARAVAASFKNKVYDMPMGFSPARLLIDIATNEFGLISISVPEEFRDDLVQNMTETHVHEVGEVSHATGLILRSSR